MAAPEQSSLRQRPQGQPKVAPVMAVALAPKQDCVVWFRRRAPVSVARTQTVFSTTSDRGSARHARREALGRRQDRKAARSIWPRSFCRTPRGHISPQSLQGQYVVRRRAMHLHHARQTERTRGAARFRHYTGPALGYLRP
eukprot:scaffold223941_cov37-Tisochrysis_lutea.AAC.2